MMPERTGSPQPSRLEPSAAWTLLTDSPLKGLCLAREAGTILAWDEGGRVYLFDVSGRQRAEGRTAGKVLAGTISDDGSMIAVLAEGPRLIWFGEDLVPAVDRLAPPDASTLASDPHGRYIAVGSRTTTNYFYSRHGRPAGKFETRQPLAHLAFIPARPFLVGASSFGVIVGVDLRPGGSGDRLAADVAWQEAVLSNVGRLTTTGDGGIILTSGFIHGVQRYDLRGHNEGAYHPGGTVSHAVADFAGRLIAVATLEGELIVLNPGGQVRWRTGLARPAAALECDPLGRFLIYGHATGEVVRLDLEPGRKSVGPKSRAAAAAVPDAGPSHARSIRKPDWSTPVAASDEQAETAVVAVLDDPPRIGLLTSANRLQVFAADGKNLGFVNEILGIGRFLRTAPGWIAAATDRQITLYDARRNGSSRLDLSLVELTHLEIRPDSFGVAVVQERDRVGRVTTAGRWIWKKELRSPVEDLAIGPDGHAALTTDAGMLEVYSPAGEPIGGYPSDPSEPLSLIEAPESSPAPVTWVTLARRAQVLRGHDLRGRVVWQAPVAWEGWRLHRAGPIALVSAPDGRTLAFDGAGRPLDQAQGRPVDGASEIFGVDPRGEPWRVVRQGVHLICADLSGRVRWRTVADEPLGPVAAGTSGVAALIGRSLAWFPDADPA
jgi:hypothetical protein